MGENKMRILCVGVGGVGSHVATLISKGILYNQVPSDTDVILADMDSVETKNLSSQAYTTDDLFKPKAKVLGERLNFGYITEKIGDISQLVGYDGIILAVDNGATRKLVYNFADGKRKVFWIDARAEGRAVSVFAKSERNTPAEMAKLNDEKAEGRSCQLKSDEERGVVQAGNVIAAAIAYQTLLNTIRGEKTPDKIIFRV